MDRCKGCRGAFHVHCMLLHGKSEDVDEMIDDEASASRKENVLTLESLQDNEEGQGRNAYIVPKRCFLCDGHINRDKRKGVAPTLEAIVKDKVLSVRVTPEPSLDAIVRGTNVTCYITINGSSTKSQK